uniref:Hes family bHLH transcription factor 5 n=1 Tax=Varanus komodoensis TaxID=61221 RepID=A0A8D2J6Y3_VARKO
MAPAGSHTLLLEVPAGEEKGRLQKPKVEKLHRDRINSSIEQLKVLLAKEFQRHQPHFKLEKAEVLETTVSYLKCSPTSAPPSTGINQDYSKGYSSCLNEVLHFLAVHTANSETQLKLLGHFQKPRTGTPKGPTSCAPVLLQKGPLRKMTPKLTSSPWRPW